MKDIRNAFSVQFAEKENKKKPIPQNTENYTFKELFCYTIKLWIVWLSIFFF